MSINNLIFHKAIYIIYSPLLKPIDISKQQPYNLYVITSTTIISNKS